MTTATSLSRVLATAALLLCASRVPAAPLLEKQSLFDGAGEGYAVCRIPGLLATRGGAVLATVEARRGGGGDWDDNDVLLRRSLDGGRSWDKPRLVAAQATYGPGPISNFVMLSDRQSGVVHALYCYKYRRVFHVESRDDGATFSAPVEITPALEEFRRDYPWRVVATGPGHGTQLRNGRFIVPVWMSDGSGKEMGKGNLGHRPSIVSLIYSDDRGRTWHRGEIICRTDQRIRNPSETVMVELADGRVLFNIRSECKQNRRLVSISPDGARGWSEPRFEPALLEPICMAGMIRLAWPAQDQASRILFANPDNLENTLVKPGGVFHDRKRLTVKMSYDECQSWPVSKVLEEGPSGYCDLAVLSDRTILCMYECGTRDGWCKNKNVALARFNETWLTDGRASATGRPREFPPLRLADTIVLNGMPVATAAPPRGLVLRPALGLLCAAAVDGQIVHRARQGSVFETRATITPAGDYLLMFPEGQHYGGAKGRKVNTLLAYRSSDHGRTWCGPTDPFHIDYSQHGFIPLIPHGSRRIYAFGTQPIPGSYDWQHGLHENAPIGFRWSDDDGRTWSAVKLIRPLNDPEFKGMSVMRMCETPSGAWLLGAHDGDWSVKPLRTRQYLLRSEDRGQTWTLLPGPRPNGWFAAGFDRMDEGRPIALGGAKVLLMSRTPQGHLFTAWSADDGRTWSAPAASALLHPDAPPMLFHLSDGKTLLALYHNRHAATTYAGLTVKMEGMKDRSEIWAATSTDDGHTWSEPRFLLANAAAPDLANAWYNYQCSYMDALVDDHVLHLFMPHRWQQVLHLTLREADLERLPTRAEIQRAAQTTTCRSAATPCDGMSPKPVLHWAKLPPIPDQQGFAGAFAGASAGALIVAGGTNVTANRWGEDFVKTWYDSAFVLESPQAAWQTGFKLPYPLAYGVSITTPDGLICAGGSDGLRHRAEVFRLQWRAGRLDHARLPDLPGPCANACGTLLGTSIYLAGGQAAPAATSALHTFWQLDLAAKHPQWVALEPWPGPERMLAVAGALRGSFYLLSGARLKAGPQGKTVRAYLRDAYCFTPGQGWRRLADLPRAAVAAPSPAVAVGDSLLVAGGDDGLHLDFQPLEKHPGFPRDVLAYNAQTGVWSVAGAAPFSLAVAPAVSWLGRVVIANGEARPRVRTPEVWSLTLQ
jgi:N-acetylneuraminic acid mutarotase